MTGLVAKAAAQTVPDSPCMLASPSFVTGEPNIFNDQQEQDLGDALAEYMESDYRIATPTADDQLSRIGERLLAMLPPTGVHYRFRIYESGEVNGFSLAGGRVYISRKMVAAVKNEDELAGVLAHELGHISTHQTAIEFTRILRIRMGVTAVTDRADIFAKVHKMLSTPAKRDEEQDTEKKDQFAADRVAVYALVRAGYAIESFASFLNESMVNKGKTGNWLTDMLGATHEDSQRYRIALKLIAALPAGCRGKQPASSEAFLAWQRSEVEERAKTMSQGMEGDRALKLESPLQPTLWRVRFSPDGKYVLAQDEGGIGIVDRQSMKMLFRIDAPDAEEAQFSLDSERIVFHDSQLRVEQWSVAKQARISVKEVVLYEGCNQTLMSSDAKTLVCASLNVGGDSIHIRIRLVDVESSQVLYDKPKFLELGPYLMLFDLEHPGNLGNMLISPDGRYALFVAANHVLAYDLERREPVSLGGKLKSLAAGRMAFQEGNLLYVVGLPNDKGADTAQTLSFPDGRVVKDTIFRGQWVYSTTKGQRLIVGPLKDYAVSVWDPETDKIVAVSRTNSIDAWGQMVAWEGAAGGLVLQDLTKTQRTEIPLPLATLPPPRAGQFSADGKYLAVSLRNRAEIWDLESGKQTGLIRPFRSAWIDNTDHLFGQFPKYMNKEPAELEMTMAPVSSKDLTKFEDDELQYHDLRLRFKPMGKGKSTGRHASLEVRKMEGETVAWSRDYNNETPVCWPADDDRLVLAWDLNTDGARAEMKSDPALQHEASAIKKRGLLLEIVAPQSGAVLRQVVIPEADLTKGREDVRRATVSGDYVLARGEHGNTVIYRIANGEKVGEFFGAVLSSDGTAGLIAAINREDEILLVDERTGKELKRFTLGSPIRLTRIVTGKEKALLVLTADQVVHRLPLPQALAAESQHF